MRRKLRLVPLLALAFSVCAVLVGPSTAFAKPDLTVESAAEPPDFQPRDGDFLATFTVGNQGTRSAGRSVARAYLSLGRVLSADDRRRRVGDRRVRRLRGGRSLTRRMIVNIPPEFQTGEYFLIICADVRNQVDETNDRANCHVSGQRMSIADRPPAGGAAGPPGPQGPAGPQGPPGEGAEMITFGRKVLPLGTATVSGTYGRGDREGSTEMFDLGEVGDVRIRALCRKTTNGDGGEPDQAPTSSGSFDQDGDEAKILLYLDQDDGTMSFDGDHGSRRNVMAGFDRRGPDPDGEDPATTQTGGEGQHQFLATARDPEGTRLGGGDPRRDWQVAYRSTGGFVSTSDGVDFILNVYAGVDVLGAGSTNCVFGGSATVVNGE